MPETEDGRPQWLDCRGYSAVHIRFFARRNESWAGSSQSA